MSGLAILIKPIDKDSSRSLCIYDQGTSLNGRFKSIELRLDLMDITEDFMNEYIQTETGCDPRTTKMIICRGSWDKNPQDYNFETFKKMLDFYKSIVETNKKQQEEKQKSQPPPKPQEKSLNDILYENKLKMRTVVNDKFELFEMLKNKILQSKNISFPIKIYPGSKYDGPLIPPNTQIEFRIINNVYYAMCNNTFDRYVIVQGESLNILFDNLKLLKEIRIGGAIFDVTNLYISDRYFSDFLNLEFFTVLMKLDNNLTDMEYSNLLQLVCSDVNI